MSQSTKKASSMKPNIVKPTAKKLKKNKKPVIVAKANATDEHYSDHQHTQTASYLENREHDNDHFHMHSQDKKTSEFNLDDMLEDSTVPKKVHTISFSLLAKRCIKNYENLQAQQIMELLNDVTHVRLDRENLHSIDGFELLDGNRVRNLYLQHNGITEIEGIDTLIELRFLTLSNNNIEKIQNLKHTKLGFLDLSYNSITELSVEELPNSLVILSLEGNPCQLIDGYRDSILKHCPNLSQLDGDMLTVIERRAAGHDVTSESEGSDDDSDTEGAQAPYDYDNPFDAQVVGVFEDMSSDMFIRCQARIQHLYDDHKERVLNLEKIKFDGGIVLDDGVSNPASRMSSRFDSPDTTDSSRPTTGNTLLEESTNNGEMSEDVGFRLAQMKMTNAAILADRMAELSTEMTSSSDFNLRSIPPFSLVSRGNAWVQDTSQTQSPTSQSPKPSLSPPSVRAKSRKPQL